MNKLFILIILNILFFSNVIAATANCSNGKCEFNNSYDYKFAKTYCLQTLNFEDVETKYLYFTILATGQKCDVFEVDEKN
tara:strand:- start:894 stop:1133 length:240 start_codon:yes stop_codon:yes gene_type:complete